MDDASEQARRRQALMDALARLAAVQTLDELVMTLRGTARAIGGADGITVVRRIGERVAYIAEDATGPLWTGQDFAIESCISGIAMIENRPILIPDIFADPRVPHTAYSSTFVKSMAIFPIGSGTPQMAMGAYWQHAGAIDEQGVTFLANLARSATQAFERVRHNGPLAA